MSILRTGGECETHLENCFSSENKIFEHILLTGEVATFIQRLSFCMQDFLRNIPGSLLCVDLYEQWMEAMETEAAEEKLQSIQR